MEASVQAGIVTRNDLLQVQLRQNETKSTRLQVENALSVSQNMLAQYTGLSSDTLDVAFAVDAQLPAFIAIRNRHWDLPANMLCYSRM